MKTVNFSILACMLSFMLFGCQTDQKLGKPSLEPRGPKGRCEVVGPKYGFKFDNGYDIISLQPIVANNHIVLLLGDSKGRTVAFLKRTVNSRGASDKKRYSEKITLSNPEKVLKLEGFDSGKEAVKFMGKRYKVYISYNRQGWLPLAETKIKSTELVRDISLMEKSLEGALRLEYVSDCLDYDKKEAQSIGTKRIASTNCFIDDGSCNIIWEHWGDQNGNEFSEPPFHDDWYPDDWEDEDDPWTAGGSPSCGGSPPSDPGNCPRGTTLYSRGNTKRGACRNARAAAAENCSRQFSCEPSVCSTCKRKGAGYKAAVRYECSPQPPLVDIPPNR